MKKWTPRWFALALEYHLFKKEGAPLKTLVPPHFQGMLRRRARAKYLVWSSKRYAAWINAHLELRRAHYAAKLEPGLLSIATPVWDGTPLPYLKVLAQSIIRQNHEGACEWLLLDNGCRKKELRTYLDSLAAQYKWVRIHRETSNLGIIGGMRSCLEHATGRYLCPVDSDDLLYPDCLQIVQRWIRASGYPPLLYSDEDKMIGADHVQPYFKPDFDPVLLLNSAYIAHLGVVDRDKALAFGAYTDKNAEGSPDWDCFVRFYLAGHDAVHIPEIIYSWRMHPESTADDAGSKPYIHRSQMAVLNRYLDGMRLSDRFLVRYTPLLPGTADWWIERQHVRPARIVFASAGETVPVDFPALARVQVPGAITAAEMLLLLPNECELLCFLDADLKPERNDWIWEAQGLFERFPDTAVVGGWIECGGKVADGPLVPGFANKPACPDEGRPVVDPGYFTQLRKQRSVAAVSSRFCALKVESLRQMSANHHFASLAIRDIGPWLGEWARKEKKRVIFSPFLQATDVSETITYPQNKPPVETPDRRYYPAVFGLDSNTAYQPVCHPKLDSLSCDNG